MILKFTSNNGQQHTDEQYTGQHTFVHDLQTQELRNDYPHGNYNANMKHIWWCNMNHLCDLVDEASTITSSMTGVDYNDDNGHEYDEAMPSFYF